MEVQGRQQLKQLVESRVGNSDRNASIQSSHYSADTEITLINKIRNLADTFSC